MRYNSDIKNPEGGVFMFAVDTAPASAVREHFQDYCADIQHGGKALIVTNHDKPEVVMLSIHDYNAMMEREYLAKLDRSEAEIARGECVTFTLEQLERLTPEQFIES